MVDYVLVQYPIINLAYYLMLLITHLVELSITACRDEEAIVTANTALTGGRNQQTSIKRLHNILGT
eukprot:scaffold14267_cov138-Skeletonema_marinoi.AAC.13